MEVPTPTRQMPAIRGESYTKDKRDIVRWVTGVLASAAIAGVGWVGTHVVGAEQVNAVQTQQIQTGAERINEVREQNRRIEDKVDRVLEQLRARP